MSLLDLPAPWSQRRTAAGRTPVRGRLPAAAARLEGLAHHVGHRDGLAHHAAAFVSLPVARELRGEAFHFLRVLRRDVATLPGVAVEVVEAARPNALRLDQLPTVAQDAALRARRG